MNKIQISFFLKNLLDNDNKIFAPIKEKSGQLQITGINRWNLNKADFSGAVPVNTFKEFILPNVEELFDFNGKAYISKISKADNRFYAGNNVLFGVNVLDLKALTLLDHVFEKDSYYQARRQKTIIVGLSAGAPDDYRQYKNFSYQFEENILEHLIFDVFLQRQVNKSFKIMTGSRKGQHLLEHFNINDYEHIEFAGTVPEQGLDKLITQNKELVETGFDDPVWEELGKICLACGKCSLVCPTCYCFNLFDHIKKDSLTKERRQTTCFYDDFSKVAQGHKFLNDAKSKLYFWYFHKFVRIPAELQIPGCVSCMRCVKACPVGIDLTKTLKKLKENKDKNERKKK